MGHCQYEALAILNSLNEHQNTEHLEHHAEHLEHQKHQNTWNTRTPGTPEHMEVGRSLTLVLKHSYTLRPENNTEGIFVLETRPDADGFIADLQLVQTCTSFLQ